MSILEYIISSVAPHECLGCGVENTLLCPACTAVLPVVPPRCYRCHALTDDFRTCAGCRGGSSLFQVWAVTGYEGRAKELLHRLKFARAQAAARDIAEAICRIMPANQATVITHAPTASARVRQRGYDQAQLIARAVARRHGMEYRPLLARRGTQRQLGQGRKARYQQMQDALYIVGADRIAGRHVLLVDDVLTTRSTCEAAAQALKAAGAARVSAVVFAVA